MSTAWRDQFPVPNDMIDAERQLVEGLGRQAEESGPELKKAFESHRAHTEKQVQRLEKVFESIGEEPEETECAGIRGLIEEHENFKEKEDAPDGLLDILNVGAATKVERYEISAYESLIQLAQQMGHRKAVQLLKPEPEKRAADAEEDGGFSKRLKPPRMGMEGENEEEAEPAATRGRRGFRRHRAA